ncbi:hypothetical protein GPECTOR_238g562 [Gonium pectorale]|uniref:MADS-box domain-containing protein n=1 Tax=Gonium pectorale TaxID=33097 RepID=A0A150FWE7_GONPE|nr:hypothetical protein GPECTOR_238g562 [Gonium pectorale]|eukprot:KXZ41944.1 hypothetical protein GPECTOR_238g562 [Gonium pectorale]
MFARRKASLVKKAMELSVLCDCDVGLIIFGPGSASTQQGGPGGPGSGPGAGPRLYQFSSVAMDELLERYAAMVAEPHERRRGGELLRHYYELFPDADGVPESATAAAATAAAAAAAASDAFDRNGPSGVGLPSGPMGGVGPHGGGGGMAPLDGMLGSAGGGGARRPSDLGGLKRSRGPSPGLGELPAGGSGLMGPGPAGLRSFLPGPGTGAGLLPGGLHGAGSAAGLGPGGLPGPVRRLPGVGGAGGLPLEGIKAAGFLDKRNYPVSPRSEKAYEELTAAFDQLTALRSRRPGGGQGLPGSGLQPFVPSGGGGGGGGGFSLAAQQQQLQALIAAQQQHRAAAAAAASGASGGGAPAGGGGGGGGAKRFKPLSILVPEVASQPIIPTTGLTPLLASGAGGSGAPLPTASSAGAGRRSLSQGGMGGGGGLSDGGAAADDLGSLMLLGGGAGSSGGGGLQYRGSIDGSAANLLNVPSPLPAGGAAAVLFGSLDGGPLSVRSSSGNGMLLGGGGLSGFGGGGGGGLSGFGGGGGSLGGGLERNSSLAMALASPGGPMGLDSALRGLAPMDGLDWPSASPRSSAGGAGPGGAVDGDGGDFPDEAEPEGEGEEGEGEGGSGGMLLDGDEAGLIVRGTSLAKLAPHAREAALGPSPGGTPSGGATPVASEGAGAAAVGAAPPPHARAVGGGGPASSASNSGAFGAASASAAAAAAAAGSDPLGADGGAVDQRLPPGAEMAATGTGAAAATPSGRGPGLPSHLTMELSFSDLSSGFGSGSGLAAAAAAQEAEGEGTGEGRGMD